MVHFIVCRKLEGYKFPVYSTVVCPKNEAEWEKRSSALMCSEENAYMCLPNEHFTELLEFCYTESRTLIEEDPSCVHIENGCFLTEPNCKSAKPTYTPKTTTDIQFENGLNDSITTISQETTKKIQLEMNPINDKKNWNLVAIIVLGTFVPICLILVTYIYFKKRASHENYTENLESRKKKTLEKRNREISCCQNSSYLIQWSRTTTLWIQEIIA